MKIKTTKIIAAIVLSSLPIMTSTVVFADDPCGKNICDPACNIVQSIKDAACSSKNNATDPLTPAITNILNAVIGMLGIVAVIFIIVGGVNYMTSNGDASKTKKAKDTILYAVIGLVICVLAFAIVNFVIGNLLKNV